LFGHGITGLRKFGQIAASQHSPRDPVNSGLGNSGQIHYDDICRD